MAVNNFETNCLALEHADIIKRRYFVTYAMQHYDKTVSAGWRKLWQKN